MQKVKFILFDWGDTLMQDYGYFGPMHTWDSVHVFPDVPETIAYLASKYTLGIATNADSSGAVAVKKALDRGGIGQHFKVEHIYSAGDLKMKKPQPQFFGHVMKHLGAGEDELCMIGDSFTNDVHGVTQLGISAIWLNRGGSEIRQGPGYTTITDFSELKKFF